MSGYLYFLICIILILILTSIKGTRYFIRQYLSEFLTAIGTIGLTIISILSGNDAIFIDTYSWKDAWPFLLILFASLLLISIIIGANRNLHNRTVQAEIDKNKELQNSINSYKDEYYTLCSNNILHLFESFYTTGDERISIYKYQGNHFTLLGRCAKNSAYNKKTNYEYKENEGLIGKGWRENEVLVTGAPKWIKKGKEYKIFMKERCNIADRRLSKIRMKSRSLFVKTINDNNTASNPDGIIVFESVSPTKVNLEECNSLIIENQKALLTLLKNMKSLTKKVS
ncbi:MAG: hypothetical protein KTR26_19950 [Flammeovirgaceae bacterium]|nr:hypothetical protein [Flammeovirgaceae bacterium]